MSEPMSAREVLETRAFVEKIASRTVCVVNLKGTTYIEQSMFSEEIGTGSFCIWKSQKLILTAKHVLKEAGPADLGFMPRIGSTIDWESEKSNEMAGRIGLPIDRIVRCQWEDLAAIVLKAEFEGRSNIDFCQLPSKFASTLSGTGAVVLMGYPVDQTCAVEKSEQGGRVSELRAVIPTTVMGEVVPTPDRPLSSRYDPDSHILIRFEPSAPNLLAFGYSGAGVWCDNRKVGSVWTADPLLAGVETDAFRKSGLLLAVRGTVVRQFLEESV